MSRYGYGVHPALSYILNHYFYDAIHFTYLSAEYYPYRRKNPRSSNPHRIYEDIYEPWKDKDEYSKIIDQSRLNIKNGVIAQRAKGTISYGTAKRLGRVCDEIDVGVFYPIVYRVNIQTIARPRLIKANSAGLGSLEYLIADLREPEIDDVLFLDYDRDEIIKELVKVEFQQYRSSGAKRVDSLAALEMLEHRIKSPIHGKRIHTTTP